MISDSAEHIFGESAKGVTMKRGPSGIGVALSGLCGCIGRTLVDPEASVWEHLLPNRRCCDRLDHVSRPTRHAAPQGTSE
jgi:hypothetical protein